MEVAIIDWKNVDSRFVRDELYEYINAPKWVDFSDPIDPVDDEAWFCKPSCVHPKTADDLLKEEERTPNSSSKLKKSSSASDIPPFRERNKRDPTLKKRAIKQPLVVAIKGSKYHGDREDGENLNPNLATPPTQSVKLGKEVTKSCTGKKLIDETVERNEKPPKLRSTQSARNLFSGGDFLNKVAEFCYKLKRLATRARDEENADCVDIKDAIEGMDENIEACEKEKDRKPLLELSKEKSEVLENSGSKQQLRRKKRTDDAENTPISIDLESIQKKTEAGNSSQIRISPPTPQCFSASNGKGKAPKPFKPRHQNQERGILQELKQEEKIVEGGGTYTGEKDARSLDVFWFLKPCTLSS